MTVADRTVNKDERREPDSAACTGTGIGFRGSGGIGGYGLTGLVAACSFVMLLGLAVFWLVMEQSGFAPHGSWQREIIGVATNVFLLLTGVVVLGSIVFDLFHTGKIPVTSSVVVNASKRALHFFGAVAFFALFVGSNYPYLDWLEDNVGLSRFAAMVIGISTLSAAFAFIVHGAASGLAYLARGFETGTGISSRR